MKQTSAILLACLLSASAAATSIPSRELAELVTDADHVVIATVTKVSMVDGDGKEIKDREGRTGPGLKNEIRLHLEVKEVLFSTAPEASKEMIVRLWRMWHYSLGGIQDTTLGNTSIFLLKGPAHDPVYPQQFERPLQERAHIERLLSARKKPTRA